MVFFLASALFGADHRFFTDLRLTIPLTAASCTPRIACATKGLSWRSTVTLEARRFFAVGYVAASRDAKAGHVVVQRIFCVNHHMRDMAHRFAAADILGLRPRAAW